MSRETRQPFCSSAAAGKHLLATHQNKMSGVMMSPASHVTAESSCSSRIIGSYGMNDSAYESGNRSHHFSKMHCNRGSVQAQMIARTQHRMLNTSMPHHMGHSHNQSILSPLSASFYHRHNVSCPVKAVPHSGSASRSAVAPKLMFLKDVSRNKPNSLRNGPSNQVQLGHRRTSDVIVIDNDVRMPSGNRHGDQSLRARDLVKHNGNQQSTHRYMYNRDQYKGVQQNVRAEFSDSESFHNEDSMSYIQNHVGSLIQTRDWDTESPVNKMTRMSLGQPGRGVLMPNMSVEYLPRGADNFRDSGVPDVDLTLVKDEPTSDEDVQTLTSPPQLAVSDTSPGRRNSSDEVHRDDFSAGDAVVKERQVGSGTIENSAEKVNENEAVVVENWTLKYARGQPAETVKIVGFPRGWDQLRRSSMIEKRISRDTLLASSGKIYRLQGPLDAVTSKNLGLSDTIITAFKNGFPDNWISVLEEWVESSDSEEDEGRSIQDYEEEEKQEEEVEEEEEQEEEQEPEIAADHSVESEDDALEIRPADIPEIKKLKTTDHKNAQTNTRRKNMREERSASEKAVKEKRVSKQKDSGKTTNSKGMSKGKSKSKSKSKSKDSKELETSETKSRRKIETKEKSDEKLSKSDKKLSNSSRKPPNSSKQKTKKTTSKEKTSKKDIPKPDKEKDEVVMKTPNQVKKETPLRKTGSRVDKVQESEKPLSIESLPRTSSGRRVKPVLAWWAGQRVFCQGDVVEIVCEASKEALKKEKVSILNFEVTPKGKAFFSENLQKVGKRSYKKKIDRSKSVVVSEALNSTIEDYKEKMGEVDSKESDLQSPEVGEHQGKAAPSGSFMKDEITEPDISLPSLPEKSKVKKGDKSQDKIVKNLKSSTDKSRRRLGMNGKAMGGKERETAEESQKTEGQAGHSEDTNDESAVSEGETVGREGLSSEEGLNKSKRVTRSRTRVSEAYSSQESALSTDDSSFVQPRSPVKLSRSARIKYRERNKERGETMPEGGVPDIGETSVAERLTCNVKAEVTEEEVLRSDGVKDTSSPVRNKKPAPRKKFSVKNCDVRLKKLPGTDKSSMKNSLAKLKLTKKRRLSSQSSQDDNDYQTTKSKVVHNDQKRLRRTRASCDDEDYQFSD